ncbi:urea transport system permease protein [Mameliella alba]|uniref:urea ABC transporter permease subunit UrtB n=1 Tax=Mameliella alba TaxID=561184 RepID=UPI00088D4AEB|nr:urea ABC transporter permease subunit UrtB [Mameliella alba]OWV48966.1 urea ABC transporter permease subunit UrtB [Mameliella alba]PTR41057.1 amino acid/amide ABC transporter membrane protein 1 (HAAT family) [Mameliella alba]GGF48453.1 branched-chain amino acid ABC transporter permease [Mameliella alba]SDC55361.1 urea transport system permease protein [Mameliella alba]
MLRALLAVLLIAWLPAPGFSQDLQSLLQEHQEEVAKPSRRTVTPVLEALSASGLPEVPRFLERWQGKAVYVREADGLFFYIEETGDTLTLLDLTSGDAVATGVASDALDQIKPNGGVRRAIAETLVQFQLSDPDITKRQDAVDAIARGLDPSQIPPLAASIDGEPDAALKTRKERLLNYLVARFGDTSEARIEAIEALSSDLSVDARAVLSQILATRTEIAEDLPEDANIARVLVPGTDLPEAEAYAMIGEQTDLPALVDASSIRTTLERHVEDGKVGGIPVGQLGTSDRRLRAYDTLAEAGTLPPRATPEIIAETLAAWTIYEAYDEPDSAITDAAERTQDAVQTRVGMSQAGDLALDAISLASIYFLAAIGLAITFGVMGVINMAHGEFIMMGAYTGYVVQLFIPDYTLSLIVALPLAFAVTFGAGVAMERLVIRWLYNRPLETLLATFGVSIALQQLAKNIFGTQARPLTSPDWLDGAWQINDVIAISYIRIAIFVLALLFLALLLFILKRTRLGLEVRAVTQNPRMAASMGINPDRIKMMTFGLGSGIAGIAGVAIGLYAKVTSEMGADYIVQSFMTVVVGGVGNVWGTLAGAFMIGTLQKGIEWFNPSNTLAAQTYMILFIILFIQFRPKGIVALKGRAAGD